MRSPLGVLLLGLLLTSCQNSGTNQPSRVIVDNWPNSLTAAKPPAVATRPRFTLYKTDNIYTLLLLDTQTGRIWQTQYAMKPKDFRGAVPVSMDVLAQGQNGRFTLTKTENMWTFILTDTTNGRVWQCQFSVSDDSRFCLPISLLAKDANHVESDATEDDAQGEIK